MRFELLYRMAHFYISLITVKFYELITVKFH